MRRNQASTHLPEDPTLQSFIRVIVFSLVFLFFCSPRASPYTERSASQRFNPESTLSQRVNATEIHTQPKHEKHCESQPVKATKLQRNRRPHGAHRFCWIADFGRSFFFVWIAPVSGKHDFCGFVFLLDCTCIWNARLLLSWFFLMV